jgi:hypothetical protein
MAIPRRIYGGELSIWRTSVASAIRVRQQARLGAVPVSVETIV